MDTVMPFDSRKKDLRKTKRKRMNHAEREIVEIVENEYLIHAGPDSLDEKEPFPWEEEAPLVVGMLVADVIRLQKNKN